MLRVAIFNDTTSSGHYGSVAVMHVLRQQLFRRGVRIVWTWPVGADWRTSQHCLALRGDVDALLVNGEGTMHDDLRRPLVSALALVATYGREKLNVPTYLLNATLNSNSEQLHQTLTQFQRIYVRDSGSMAELADHRVSATVVPDLTLGFDVARNDYLREGFAGTDSVLPSISSQIRSVCVANGWPFKRMSPVRFPGIGLLRTPGAFLSRARDWLEDRSNRFAQVEDFVSWLGSHRLVVTGRYHTVCMCLLTGTPFIAVESNTPKITSLLRDALSSTARLLSRDKLADIDAERFASWTNEEVTAIESFQLNAKASITDMFDDIVEDIALREVEIDEH